MAPSKTIPWRRFATPDAEFTYASSGSQSSPDTMEFQLSGKNGGESITIDWGDGTVETLNLTTSTQGFSHDYTVAGDFTIRMFRVNQKFDFFRAIPVRQPAFSGDTKNLPKGGLSYDFGVTKLSGEIANIPRGAAEYDFLGTKVTGIAADLPPGASGYNFAFTNLTGNVANLPGGADNYRLNNTGLTGKAADLPTGANRYNLNNTDLQGDVADLPTGAVRYLFANTNLTGVTADIPTGAGRYRFDNTGITGSAGDLPKDGRRYGFSNNSLTGDFQFLHALTSFPRGFSFFLFANSGINSYTSGSFTTDYSSTEIRMQDNSLSSSEVDNFLIDLEASGASDGTLNIAGTNAARTSSSDAAVSALQSRGWSITVNT